MKPQTVPTRSHRLIALLQSFLPVLFFLLFQAALVYASSGGEGAGGHGAAAVDEGKKWGELGWRALNFAIFFIVLIVLIRKPLKQAMAGRREGIQKELDELEQKKEAAKKELALFESRLAGMKEEREAIFKDFQNEGEREKQKIIEAGRRTAARIVEQAQLTVQQEIQKANLSLREEVAEMSVKMAEDLLRKHITDTDQKVLIGEYLAKVVH